MGIPNYIRIFRKLQFILEKERIDWFHNLDLPDQDNIAQFLSYSIHHYGKMNKDVEKDMEHKFGITSSQTQQLYEFLFLYFKESDVPVIAFIE